MIAMPSIFGGFSLVSHSPLAFQVTEVLGITGLIARFDMEFISSMYLDYIPSRPQVQVS